MTSALEEVQAEITNIVSEIDEMIAQIPTQKKDAESAHAETIKSKTDEFEKQFNGLVKHYSEGGDLEKTAHLALSCAQTCRHIYQLERTNPSRENLKTHYRKLSSIYKYYYNLLSKATLLKQMEPFPVNNGDDAHTVNNPLQKLQQSLAKLNAERLAIPHLDDEFNELAVGVFDTQTQMLESTINLQLKANHAYEEMAKLFSRAGEVVHTAFSHPLEVFNAADQLEAEHNKALREQVDTLLASLEKAIKNGKATYQLRPLQRVTADGSLEKVNDVAQHISKMGSSDLASVIAVTKKDIQSWPKLLEVANTNGDSTLNVSHALAFLCSMAHDLNDLNQRLNRTLKREARETAGNTSPEVKNSNQSRPGTPEGHIEEVEDDRSNTEEHDRALSANRLKLVQRREARENSGHTSSEVGSSNQSRPGTPEGHIEEVEDDRSNTEEHDRALSANRLKLVQRREARENSGHTSPEVKNSNQSRPGTPEGHIEEVEDTGYEPNSLRL